MKSHRSYLYIFFCLALIVPGLVATVNVAIDPYGYFGTRLVPGFNILKPELGLHEKELKVHLLTTLRPDGLILGASTSDVGLDPEHRGWTANTVYNLSAGQSSISLARHLLLHAMEFQVPKQVVLGLDMSMFNPSQQIAEGINPASLAVLPNGERNRDYLTLNYYGYAFSLDMLNSARTTLRANRENPSVIPAEYEPQISSTGQMNPKSFPQNRWKTYRQRFQRMVGRHVNVFWAPLDPFRQLDDFQTDPTFGAYQDILQIACKNNIELQIVLSPMHAYLLEAQEATELTAVWERWKSAVVLSASSQEGCEPFPVWDFSGYNSITTEIIAQSREETEMPAWYWDPVHYTTEVGDIMLNRVFGIIGADDRYDFGVQLTADNLSAQISLTRQKAVAYRSDRPDEVAVVNQTVLNSLKTENR